MKITTKEVAKILNISLATVYKYIKEEKIVPVNHHRYRHHKSLLFEKDEILSFSKHFQRPEGKTVSEIAKEIGVHSTSVSRYIHNGTIQANKVFYKGREQYFINEDQIENIKTLFSNQIEKVPLSTSDKQYYLYQLFSNPMTSEVGRITKIDGNEVNFLDSANNYLNREQLERSGYRKIYDISNEKYINKKGYVQFMLPEMENIQDSHLKVFDLLYKEIGPQNMRIIVEDGEHILEIKPCHLKISLEEYNEEIQWMMENTFNGTIDHEVPGSVLILNELESITIYLPTAKKQKIKKQALKNGLTLEEHITKILLKKL